MSLTFGADIFHEDFKICNSVEATMVSGDVIKDIYETTLAKYLPKLNIEEAKDLRTKVNLI